ncbi:DUF427 domain-containing protein [Streptomyces albus subsp. chlorinus]|uniref:DUF427 domain-containing protein n=1 Tax=Streptomyces albus TaxID=1888 RepID=UPI00156DA140|nr:DUF427 domain-containing protein [Streptomyces albus]NSC22421.1 DUF427 domain-containing protein [Streptomyces albus subsp. chlorinus]
MSATGHTITVEEGTERVRVTHGDRVLADSSRPLLLSETGYPVRYYLPPEDVRTDLLVPSDTRTRCPFKGTASYWSLADGGAEDIAWSYPEPLGQVSEIKGCLCFPDVEVG